jgi:hypothetical protein
MDACHNRNGTQRTVPVQRRQQQATAALAQQVVGRDQDILLSDFNLQLG